MDFKKSTDDLVKKEYEQVKKWVKNNIDQAANLILNFYCDMFTLQIDFETHALPNWLEIKKLTESRELPPVMSFDGTDKDAIKKLSNLKTEKEYKEYMNLKIKGEDNENNQRKK